MTRRTPANTEYMWSYYDDNCAIPKEGSVVGLANARRAAESYLPKGSPKAQWDYLGKREHGWVADIDETTQLRVYPADC